MDLLEFARGPALQWSLMICLFGLFWRLTGIMFQPKKPNPDYSQARHTDTRAGAFSLIISRMWPKAEFQSGSAASTGTAYVFHIGLFIVVFFAAPHIEFFRDLFGFSWPNLPNTVVTVAGALSLLSLVAMLFMRLGSPVKRLLSNFDDYFSWLVTTLPVVTGLAATAHVGGRYETVLAWHILTVELLLIWLPFGKLMHMFLVFVSRGTTGAAFTRKGASL